MSQTQSSHILRLFRLSVMNKGSFEDIHFADCQNEQIQHCGYDRASLCHSFLTLRLLY